MTSKVLFFNLIRENIKQRIGSITISILVCFICFPLALLVGLENIKMYAEPDYFETFMNVIGWSPQNILVIGVIAIICGISGFSYLFSKTKVDFYHSLPIKREKLFLASYINGILIYIIPYVVFIGICLIISGRYIGFSGILVKTVIINIFINLIYYLLFYHVVIIAVVLTGNKISCFLMLFVLLIYVIAVKSIGIMYQDVFFDTFYFRDTLLLDTKFTSPLLTMIYGNDYWRQQIENGGIYNRELFFFLLQSIFFSLCYGILGFWLFKKRASESAGKSIAFPIIQDIYRILLVIPIALGSGIFFQAISSSFDLSWLIFGLLFGILLGHCLLEILFHMDIKKAFCHKRQLGITGAFILLFAFSMYFDWWNYDTYLPKENKIKSMGVTISGINNNLYYDEEQKKLSVQYTLDNMKITDYDSIYQLIKENIEYRKSHDYMMEDEFVQIDVKYNLTNGKEAYRQYEIKLTEEAYEGIRQIVNNEDYKKTVYQILSFDEKDIAEIEIFSVDSEFISLNAEQIPEFLSIYRKELETLTFDEMQEQDIIADVSFRHNSSSYILWGYPVYSNFTETIKYLQAYIEIPITEFEVEKIQDIIVDDYNRTIQYKEREEIEQLYQNLKPAYETGRYTNWFFNRYDEYDYEIKVFVKYIDDNGKIRTKEAYYWKENIPELIKRDFKLQETE